MSSDLVFKAKVVELILMKEPESAIKMLSQHYRVEEPTLKVGRAKGYTSRVLGVYTSRKKTILVINSEILYNPFVLIHEFYHHLRTHGQLHKGTEKYADKFAKDFIEAYRTLHGRLT